MRSIALAALILALSFPLAMIPAEPIKCPVTLLKGYKHEAKQGIDSRPGVIYKVGGLRVQYDIGGMALCAIMPGMVGKYFEGYTEQVINGTTVRIAFKKNQPKECIIALPQYHANFFATIGTPQEMADMLLMALSFNPEFLK